MSLDPNDPTPCVQYVFRCVKHGDTNVGRGGTACPHCAADAEILEDKIEAVVKAAWTVMRIDYPPLFTPGTPGQTLRDALRELVREVRR